MEPEKDIIEEEFLLDENKNDENNNKCLKYTFVSICIFVIIGAIIAASNLFYTHKNDKISKNIPELIRLKNWEFGSEEKINLTGERYLQELNQIIFLKLLKIFMFALLWEDYQVILINIFMKKSLKK